MHDMKRCGSSAVFLVLLVVAFVHAQSSCNLGPETLSVYSSSSVVLSSLPTSYSLSLYIASTNNDGYTVSTSCGNGPTTTLCDNTAPGNCQLTAAISCPTSGSALCCPGDTLTITVNNNNAIESASMSVTISVQAAASCSVSSNGLSFTACSAVTSCQACSGGCNWCNDGSGSCVRTGSVCSSGSTCPCSSTTTCTACSNLVGCGWCGDTSTCAPSSSGCSFAQSCASTQCSVTCDGLSITCTGALFPALPSSIDVQSLSLSAPSGGSSITVTMSGQYGGHPFSFNDALPLNGQVTLLSIPFLGSLSIYSSGSWTGNILQLTVGLQVSVAILGTTQFPLLQETLGNNNCGGGGGGGSGGGGSVLGDPLTTIIAGASAGGAVVVVATVVLAVVCYRRRKLAQLPVGTFSEPLVQQYTEMKSTK